MPVTPAPYPDALTGRALIFKHLPPHIVDSEGWAIDMFAAFAAMDIPVTTGNVCGVIAVIEQESGFSSNPKVPGLSKIALAEVERRRAAAGIPKWSMNLLLDLKSPDGKTYRNRLNAVRTERDLSGIYEDLMYARPFGATLFSYHNPIQTAGSMQVSVTFAEAHIKNRRYPYPIQKDVRNELFSRRGGVYFGVAHLFDYQTSYKKPIYRFADHNAGQYSSRNAAFQAAVSAFTGISIATDGDLLRYKDSTPITTEGVTLSALLANGGRLKLSADQIKQDLLLEKSYGFEQSKTYQAVYALVDVTNPSPLPRELVPDIHLHSPKIKRHRTTAWFAEQVNRRFNLCLQRQSHSYSFQEYENNPTKKL